MHQRILLPTDGLPQSNRAVEIGLELARRLGAKAIVVFVVQPSTTPYGLGTGPNSLDAVAQAVLRPWQERAQTQGLDVATHYYEDADIAEGIVQSASQHRCDLIVMGTHGREGLARLFLGSVAERVLRLAKTPVLLLRFNGALKTPAHFPKRILVPLDGGLGSEMALDQAAEFACKLRAELRLLHVVPQIEPLVRDMIPLIFDVPDADTLSKRLSEEGKLILQRAQAKSGSSAPTILRQAGREQVARVILQVAQEEAADLIAMGTHGYTGFDRLLLGSVANAVSHHSSIPVLLIRPQTTNSV